MVMGRRLPFSPPGTCLYFDRAQGSALPRFNFFALTLFDLFFRNNCAIIATRSKAISLLVYTRSSICKAQESFPAMMRECTTTMYLLGENPRACGFCRDKNRACLLDRESPALRMYVWNPVVSIFFIMRTRQPGRWRPQGYRG